MLRGSLSLLSLAALLALKLLAAPQSKQNFTGVVTDSMCATADHGRMRMGPTDGECTKACIKYHDAMYMLYDGKEAYTLSDQKAPEQFAGQKVTVTGTMDAKTKTIQVEKIVVAK
jgi:hypothetical protein